MVGIVIVDGAPLSSVSDFGVWDFEMVVCGREFVGHPTAPLVVVLDDIPEAMCEIKLNRNKQAFVIYKVSLYFS